MKLNCLQLYQNTSSDNPHLLQESYQSTGAPLVQLGQVDVLQVENEPLAVFGSVHSASVSADDHAGLAQFLQEMLGGGLCATVNRGDVSRPESGKRIPEQHPVKDKTLDFIHATNEILFIPKTQFLLLITYLFSAALGLHCCRSLPLAAESRDRPSCGLRASLCGGPRGRAQTLGRTGFSSCGAGAWKLWFPSSSTGSIVVAHNLSCSAACGIFLDQGLHLCLQHWQMDSLPLSYQGRPQDF